MKETAGLLFMALLGACSADKASGTKVGANTVTFNDFEAGGGWSNDPGRNDPGLLDKGRAHSGQYALKADKDHEFSLTFDMALGRIRTHKFKTLHLEAWAFMPNDKATGVLVLQVMEPSTNQQLYGDGLKLRDAVKSYNQWVPISKDFTLPDNITLAQHLRLSLWRADAGEEVLVDDVHLSMID
ncbi:MAG TPA: hypothetical protein VF598_14300 [Hymenobacter sp.]